MCITERIWCLKKMDKKLVKYMDEAWDHIRNWNQTKATLHITLLLLVEKLMDRLSQPILLTDFFMNSLDAGMNSKHKCYCILE